MLSTTTLTLIFTFCLLFLMTIRPFMAKNGKSNGLGSFFGNVFSLFIVVVLIITVVLKYYHKS